MTLANYISDLLYRYECVIVPNFGGFVSNDISARVNNFTHTFYPPTKQLTFNSHLKKNDGLLANYMASAENISYAKAITAIENEVESWKQLLHNEALELDAIGVFSLNKEGKPVFEPDVTSNYLTSSFGLSTFVSPAVKRLTYKEKVAAIKPIPLYIEAEKTRRKTPVFLKYAATVALMFALGSVGWKEYQKFEYNKLVNQAEMKKERINK